MPTKLGRNRAKTMLSQRLVTQTVWGNLPWGGIAPDLNETIMDFSILRECIGLVDKGGILMADAGFAAVDIDRLPLNSGKAIIGLMQMTRSQADGSDYDPKQHIIAITAPTGSGTASPMFYLNNLNQWENIPHSGTGTDDLANNASNADRDVMYSWCVLEDGAPDRSSYTTALSGDVDEPCLVFTNNIDPVQIYPVDPGGGYSSTGVYETMTDNASYAPFLAKSVEAFDGRVLYFNTEEVGVRHKTRVRWSQVGSAEPSTAVGAGAMDMVEFNRQGLCVKRLGNRVALYAEDGIAFLTRTMNPQQPFYAEYISNERGLMGPFAVCAVSNDTHFGIFTDGWFLVDMNGQMVELGFMDVGGVKTSKWKRTFYGLLDVSQRERIVCSYDNEYGYIRIAFPRREVDTSTDNEVVWVYELSTDRLFTDLYPVTTWGVGDLTLAASTTWNTATGTWEEATGTWRSMDTTFALRKVLHGTKNGYVVVHNPNIYTHFDDASEEDKVSEWAIFSARTSLQHGHINKSINKVLLQYAELGSQSLSFVIGGNLSSTSGTVAYGSSITEEPNVVVIGCRGAGTTISFGLMGSHPVKILNVGVQLKFSRDESQLPD